MYYSQSELSSLNRKELQKLCKQFGVKANRKNVELVDDLFNYFNKLQNEEQALQNDLKVKEVAAWISDDDERKPEDEDNMKEEVLKEVERRAQEKITKIPQFKPDCLFVPGTFSPGSKSTVFHKKHKKELRKLDSIDVYMEKKRKRAEERFSYHKKLKTNAESTIKRMKMSHNTPAPTEENTQKRKSLTKIATPLQSKVTAKSPMFKKSALKIDKEVSFNFVSKLKSPKVFHAPRVSPRLCTLKERDVNIKPKIVPSAGRKSVQFTNVSKSIVKSGNELNRTLGDLRSPGVITGITPGKKTPIKFDLQQSLKKRLSYKPHTGKLKKVYFDDRKSVDANRSLIVNKSFTDREEKKVGLKEMTKNVSNRNQRRAAAVNRRETKRTDALAKRRGIVC